MIALISFDDAIVMQRAKAEELGLKYQKGSRYGIKVDEKVVHEMAGYDYYLKDLYKHTEELEDGRTKVRYYSDAELTKSVSSYYQYLVAPDEDWVTINQKNNLVQLEDFVLKCREKFYIEQALPTQAGDPTSLAVVLDRVTKKFDDMLLAAEKLEKSQFNERCNVHVGGGLITTYNELMLKEDVCTDVMQDLLNKGWRIIAVCVQPDQRRPDYILGRYNSDMDIHNDALRRG